MLPGKLFRLYHRIYQIFSFVTIIHQCYEQRQSHNFCFYIIVFLKNFYIHNFYFQDGKSRVVRQFQFIEWPSLIDNGDLPLAATLQQRHPTDSVLERFVDFVQQVHQTKSQFGSTGPICVHDARGAGIVNNNN